MKTIKKTMQFLSVPLLCGLGVFILFRFVLFLGYVPSASMENCSEVILLSLRETELAW